MADPQAAPLNPGVNPPPGQPLPSNIIAQKAQAVAQHANLTPKASALNFGAILAFITQLLQGLSLCPTTPASVHGAISNPTPMQQRRAQRLARQTFRRDPIMQETILEGTYAVGKTTTEAEAVAMYQQANGRPPG